MTPLDPRPDDGPELVPPPELQRLRSLLMRPPAAGTRAQHLAATTVAARQRSISGPMGRFASRGARLAVGVVATLAITSGLAGAQLLPQSAQRLFSTVTDRFAPTVAPTPTTIDEPAGDPSPASDDSDTPDGAGVGPRDDATTTTDTAVTLASPTSLRPTTTTTLLGPIGPGSPDDPTDPGTTTTTEPEPTTTTEPGPTTTTTQPGTTTTSSSTTTTTAPPK